MSMKTEVEHIITILEKIDDFPESVKLMWGIIVGDDNLHHLLYGDVVSQVKTIGVQNTSWQVAIKSLSDIRLQYILRYPMKTSNVMQEIGH